MTSRKEPSTALRISDFFEIFSKSEDGDSPVVVGGQSVNLWSEYYLSKGVTELAEFMPFTSKDLDLIGSDGILERLHNVHKGKLLRAEPRGPALGRLDIVRKDGSPLRVEVLHSVKGLDAKDLSKTMELQVEGASARVLMPHVILKAKIENVNSIPQQGRNDVKHVRMMILCVHSFLGEFADHVGTGQVASRTLVNLLEEIHEIISASRVEKLADKWGFQFKRIWPLDAFRALRDEKVARWMKHRTA